MLRVLFILFFFATTAHAQINYTYSYKEVCSEEKRTMNVLLGVDGNIYTLSFFGETQTFTPTQVAAGEVFTWMERTYSAWSEYYPCAEIQGAVQDATKKVAQGNEVDVGQPVLVVSSDFSYYEPNSFKFGSGYSSQNRLTGNKYGALSNVGNAKVSNIGYYRITPLSESLNRVETFNLLYIEGDLLGNVLNGVYYFSPFADLFLFHNLTFGNLNGFGFQDNTAVAGINRKIFSTPQMNLSFNTFVTYTYFVKVFKISYWMEDHVKVIPNLSFTFKLSPTFGLNLTGTFNYRSDTGAIYNKGILLGGRLSF